MQKNTESPKKVGFVCNKTNKGNLRLLKTVAAASTLIAVLGGCSSMLNIGSSEYGCPGMPGGVQCMSARDVYAATNDGNVPLPMKKEDTEGVRDKQASSQQFEQRSEQPAPNDVVANYVAPRLPDQPIPIRTPAQVMRIWIAPWEDANGDLNTTGYVYTEIEPRRWVLGEAAGESAPVLRPLQTIKPSANDSRQSSPAAATQAEQTAQEATARAAASRQ